MDPMMITDEPKPGSVYLIKVIYRDGSNSVRLGRFQGYDRGLAMWSTPPDDTRKGEAAEVEIIRQIPLDDRP